MAGLEQTSSRIYPETRLTIQEFLAESIKISGDPDLCKLNTTIDPLFLLDGRIYNSSFSFSPGGVGRNLCEAMYKLQCPPNFLTVVGDDFYGATVKSSIPKICTHLLKTNKDEGTAQCLIVFDKKGSCKMLMGDMEVHNKITPQMILDHKDFFIKSPLIIIEANLNLDTIDTILDLADKNDIPVLYEPTDPAVAAKPFRSKNYKAIKFITPNLKELKEIATFLDINYTDSSKLEDVANVARELVDHIDNVIVTLGSKGILIARKALASDTFSNGNMDQNIHIRHYPTVKITELINVSGAGDCFASGFMTALISNKSEEICVSVGFAAAKLALQTKSAVPEVIFDNLHESWHIPAKYTSVLKV